MDEQKMHPDIKARWLAALRSGEYTQGADMLCTPDGAYCCLGVLCDLYAKEKGVSLAEAAAPRLSASCDLTHPSVAVYMWAGLPATANYTPEVVIGSRRDALTNHNDGIQPVMPKRTFAEIADAIEEQL